MSLIGSVVERTPNATGSTTSVTPFPVSSDPKTGFPAVAHRSQRQRKSAFRQNMEAARPINRDATIPVVKSSSEVTDANSGDSGEDTWRTNMEAENARKIALMTPEERDEELRQLSSKFGDIAELSNVLRRAKDSRARTDNKRTTSPTIEDVSDEDKPTSPPLEPPSPPQVRNPQHRVANPARPVLSRRSSVSGVPRSGTSTPGTAGVRFAEVTSRDVFTYPSAPTSPRRTTLMIEAPPAEGTGENIPKVQWKGKTAPAEATKAVHPNPQLDSTGLVSEAVSKNESKKQESAHPLSQVVSSSSSTPPELTLAADLSGSVPPKSEADASAGAKLLALDPIDTATPEAIRQQYFPTEPKNNPNLEWIADLPEIPDTPITSEYAYIDGMGEKARFNLAGTPIPQDIAKEMPAHDGLHHNSRSTAGYTLGELLHLARSTAPMQRAMALDALARLTARVGRRELGAWFPRGEDSRNQDQVTPAQDGNKRVLPAAELRKLVIDSATPALNERGAVGTRAIDCLYAALVIWDHEFALVDDVELSLRPAGADASNLHVMPSNYVTPTIPVNESGLDEMKVVDNLALEPILETAVKQFSARSLPRSVLGRLLEVIVRLSRQSRAHASSIIATKELIAEIMRSFILSGSPYPDSSDPSDPEQPNALAIRLLAILARSSRQNASSLLDPTDILLRFVAVLPPDNVAPTFLIATLDLYSVLGQYGMYAHIATTAADSFDALSKYVRRRGDAKLTKSWMQLRMVWTACAIDPHSTTPPHEILWSQVDGWGWGEDTIAWARDGDAEASVIAGAWNALTVWLEGAAVNSIRAGAAEREQVIKALGEGFRNGHPRSVLESAISRLSASLSEESPIHLLDDQSLSDACLIYSALRLDLALLLRSSQDDDSTLESPLGLPLEAIARQIDDIALNPIWARVYSDSTISPYSYARMTSLALCIASFLLLAKRTGQVRGLACLRLSFIALHRLNPSCADTAARLIQEIGATIIREPGLAHLSIHLKQANWSALLPFLLHDLQPSAEFIVAPPISSSASVSHVTTLLLPSRPSLGGKLFGLPMHNDWTANALNHLLHSGTSPAFKSLPNEWNSDEVDVVRATLALACARQNVLSKEPTFRMTSSEVSFGCMRVFMLEHDQPHDDSSSEIFRDPHNEQMMSYLLNDVSLCSEQTRRRVMASPLETVANVHLSGQPFYQFYSDLVGLYDAISFAHPIFSRILLPPLSMNYAKDYRRLFWGDYGHLLRSIQTEISEVPSRTLEEWLWPRDTDGEMIGWYVKALMKGGVQGFLRFIAVHHIATSIWPEFDSEGTNGWDVSPEDKERTRMIIGAMVHQAGPALFSALMLYEQKKDDITPYPACYEGHGLNGEHRRRRLEWAISLCGERVRERLEYVYNA